MAAKKKSAGKKKSVAKKKGAAAKKKPARKKSAKKKSAGKKSVPKKTAAKGAKKSAPKAAPSRGPKPVTTGRGPGPLEVATQVAALLRAGRTDEVERLWLGDDVESVEGMGASAAWRGKASVLDKYRAWEADHQIHEMKVEGPWVGATGFALKYWVDVTETSSGQRTQMEEIAVYEVRNGKITREEFHFATGG